MQSDLHSLPVGSRPENVVRNSGPDSHLLERYRLRELAEGWPMYRSDACEWENFESIFDRDAHVCTTWSGKVHYEDFIAASKAGMDEGIFIMHRCHGLSTDINETATRAVTKMKATITQRFVLDGCEVDAEVDCRFLFFWDKVESRVTHLPEWKAKFVRHWYEKDKLIPVDPRRVPELDQCLLDRFPSGYRYLAYCQQKLMGLPVDTGLPGHNRERRTHGGSHEAARMHDLLYWQAKEWLAGCNPEF
ncbi:hypothetical protein PV08_05485 [Exophiala spinifera]|uniref:SnoaL-like domain-containing protein n=1 Tax=Exophiala spinifera TaxID=91928 RepID=A0A0D2BW03_9EURO|nr:uncharacterized protein PV08_05485 [Exophiala spinifera]KIW15439.1 hypothetical protein PV08_05485 [Exophiala spinifera]